MTEAEYKAQFEPTKDNPHVALTGELWGVFCEDLGENRAYHISTALYMEVPK